MAIFLVLAWSAVTLGLLAALLTAPRWLMRSAHRHRMWHLRDRVVDDIIEGRLPGEHPAVMQLVDRVETSIAMAPRQTLFALLLYRWLLDSTSSDVRRELDVRNAPCSEDGLTDKQCHLLEEHREDLRVLITGSVLLGSWLGVLRVMLLLPRAAREVRRSWREQPSETAAPSSAARVASRATDDAVTRTSLGRSAASAVLDPPALMPV